MEILSLQIVDCDSIMLIFATVLTIDALLQEWDFLILMQQFHGSASSPRYCHLSVRISIPLAISLCANVASDNTDPHHRKCHALRLRIYNSHGFAVYEFNVDAREFFGSGHEVYGVGVIVTSGSISFNFCSIICTSSSRP